MITLNGQKMGKSLGNAISLEQFFNGDHELIEQAYSPMTIRFFMLQAHYRSTLDFSNEALQASEKGLKKLMTALNTIESLEAQPKSSVDIAALKQKCFDAMNDDFNSPILMAHLFDGVKMINLIKEKKESISAEDLSILNKLYYEFIFDILGLKTEEGNSQHELVDGLMQSILNIRQNARANKDFATSDLIRDELAKINITIKDTRDGVEWHLEN